MCLCCYLVGLQLGGHNGDEVLKHLIIWNRGTDNSFKAGLPMMAMGKENGICPLTSRGYSQGGGEQDFPALYTDILTFVNLMSVHLP